MPPLSSISADTGLEVTDVRGNADFAARPVRPRNFATQMEGLQRIAHTFADSTDNILDELVNTALTLCDADTAGISIEKPDRTESNFYEWVAVAGQYSSFLNATLPREPSACTICLGRGAPQVFTVGKPFFDTLGVVAPLVTDGLLLPWQANDTRGTIFIIAHGRTQAFDSEDVRVMNILADFAAMGVRQQHQHQSLLRQASAAAAASMANDLAHRINNPLQSLTNHVYLAANTASPGDAKKLAEELTHPLHRLTTLVKELLSLEINL